MGNQRSFTLLISYRFSIQLKWRSSFSFPKLLAQILFFLNSKGPWPRLQKGRIIPGPTCPYVFVNSILYIANNQNFYSSCSMRYSPWQGDEWIFPALHLGLTSDPPMVSKVHNGINDSKGQENKNKIYTILFCVKYVYV